MRRAFETNATDLRAIFGLALMCVTVLVQCLNARDAEETVTGGRGFRGESSGAHRGCDHQGVESLLGGQRRQPDAAPIERIERLAALIPPLRWLAAEPREAAIRLFGARMAVVGRSRSLGWWTENGQMQTLMMMQDGASDRQVQTP
jgi:hypothetical protein